MVVLSRALANAIALILMVAPLLNLLLATRVPT
jgi:hypothetical protein